MEDDEEEIDLGDAEANLENKKKELADKMTDYYESTTRPIKPIHKTRNHTQDNGFELSPYTVSYH